VNDPLNTVLSQVSKYKQVKDYYMAICPAHDDHNPSLKVSQADDGKVLLKCYAGCDTESVVRAMGLKMNDLFTKSSSMSSKALSSPRPRTAGKNASVAADKRSGHRNSGDSDLEGMLVKAIYEYVDELGKPLFTVLRYEDPKGIKKKTFRQEPAAGYKQRNKLTKKRPMDDVPRVLYRLPRVLRTIERALPVIVVEGEKDVHSLEHIGLVATCNSGGAGKWLSEYNSALQGGNILIIADNDDPGRLHAEMVARNLSGIAGRIRVLQLPDLKEHGDVTDWITAGGTKDRLIEIAKACPDWVPSPEYDETLTERNNHGRAGLPANHTLSPEDEARALEIIETAIAAGTAAAIYGDECITSLAMLSEGTRADLIQKISASIKAVGKRDIKKKVAAKFLEMSPLTVAYIAPEGQSGQLLSPNIPIKESCESALSTLVKHNDPMRLFRRGGRMSRIRPNDQGAMKIEELSKEGIAYELNSLIDFYYVNPHDGETKHVTAPKHIIDYLYAHPNLPFSVIDGVTEIPVLRKDGTILDKIGYDEATHMYYHPPDGITLPPIPENPTSEERKHAAELLREVFCDMPFISETDRTHTIALLLSPILRQITGTTPLALINAHQPSNGKSLLSDAISLVTTGRTANNVTAPIDPREWESFLAALLFSGEPLVFFDNVKHYIESASLEKVLTSEEVTSRVLGKSTALTVVNRITFALTGNNVQVGREIARRSYIIDLDAQMSNPEDRSVDSYCHPDLKSWIRENRGRIVWSLFVIIRAWFADGCPKYKLPQVGSFEKWCVLVGNIVTHAGFGGFLGNRDRLRRDSDQESAQWEAFLERWIELYGDSQKPVSAVAFDMTCDDKLGGVIPEDLSYCIKGNETNNVKIGRVFKRRDGSRFGPRQMRLCQGPIIRGQRMWTVLHEMDLASVGTATVESKIDLVNFADLIEPAPTHSPIFGVDTFDLALMPDDWDEDEE